MKRVLAFGGLALVFAAYAKRTGLSAAARETYRAYKMLS